MVKKVSLFLLAVLFLMLIGCSKKINDNSNTDNRSNDNELNNKPSLDNNDLFASDLEPATSIKDVSIDGHYIGKVGYIKNSLSNLKTDVLFSFSNGYLYVWTEEKYDLEERIFDSNLLDNLNEIDKNNYQELLTFPTLGYFAVGDVSNSTYYAFIISKDSTIYSFELSLDENSFEVLAIYRFIDNRFDSYDQLYMLDGKQYGRLISSSESREDPIRVYTRHFTDLRYAQYQNVVAECNVIYELDILYGVYVKWDVEHGGTYEENVISLKKSVADVTVRNVIYNDEPSYDIKTIDQEQFMKALSYITTYVLLTQKVLLFDITDENNKLAIDFYSKYYVHGDWGLKGCFVYTKMEAIYDKESGSITYGESIELKRVFVGN